MATLRLFTTLHRGGEPALFHGLSAGPAGERFAGIVQFQEVDFRP